MRSIPSQEASRSLIVKYSTKQLSHEKNDPGPFKLYVSNLSKQTNEDDIRSMFALYGTLIDDVVILRDPNTKESKGRSRGRDLLIQLIWMDNLGGHSRTITIIMY